jgi:hypothetical protein
MVFGKPERIPHPHSDEACTVVPKRMQYHVVNDVRLCRTPDRDIEPHTRAGRGAKEVCTERGEVQAVTWHNSASGVRA